MTRSLTELCRMAKDLLKNISIRLLVVNQQRIFSAAVDSDNRTACGFTWWLLFSPKTELYHGQIIYCQGQVIGISKTLRGQPINPYKRNELSLPYHVDESTSIFRGLRSIFSNQNSPKWDVAFWVYSVCLCYRDSRHGYLALSRGRVHLGSGVKTEDGSRFISLMSHQSSHTHIRRP